MRAVRVIEYGARNPRAALASIAGPVARLPEVMMLGDVEILRGDLDKTLVVTECERRLRGPARADLVR